MTARAEPVEATVVVRDQRRVIAVAGEDRRSFLDATLSQSLVDLPPGSARSALWLDIHGAPLAVLDVVAPPSDEVLLLVVDPSGADAVLDVLANRTFLSQATFTATDATVVAVRGTTVAIGEAETAREDGGVLVVGRRDGFDLVGTAEQVDDWLDQRGLRAGDDLAALLDHEVRHGQPRVGAEVLAPHLPEEAGLLPTHVHLDKGCYPGQEAVARMWMLGRPRRRLVVLELDGPATPGDEVGTGRDRVTITRSTSTAPWAALAYAPADVVPGQEVIGDGWVGRVKSIVGFDAQQPGAKPAVMRRRDRNG